LFRGLETSGVSDALDKLGIRGQCLSNRRLDALLPTQQEAIRQAARDLSPTWLATAGKFTEDLDTPSLALGRTLCRADQTTGERPGVRGH
jgi:hypothetical protein